MLSRKQAIVKLDIDDHGEPDMAEIHAKAQRAGHAVVMASVRPSPGGSGWHVTLHLEPRPRTPMEVVALQAILGSDPWREAMQMVRARAFRKCPGFMRDAWNVLYLPDKRRVRRINLRKVLARLTKSKGR